MPDSRLTRRTLLKGSAAAAGVLAVDALGVEPNWLEVTLHDVPVAGLPRALDGYALAQITDAHLTRLGTVEQTIVEALDAHDVQAVALTGDIVDSDERLGVLAALLSELQRPGRTLIATLGNWEHWGRVDLRALEGRYRDAGARLLVNEALVADGGVSIAATDDALAGQPSQQDIAGERRGDASVLLTHSPELLDRLDAGPGGRFDVALAGHTHGGQLRLGASLVPWTPPGSGRFVAGWYETPRARAYVSRGTGTSIVPVRFTCRPELPILRLRQG